MVEAIIGAILVAGTLVWSRYSGLMQKRGAESGESASTAARLVPGLLLVLGVTLLVDGITGS